MKLNRSFSQSTMLTLPLHRSYSRFTIPRLVASAKPWMAISKHRTQHYIKSDCAIILRGNWPIERSIYVALLNILPRVERNKWLSRLTTPTNAQSRCSKKHLLSRKKLLQNGTRLSLLPLGRIHFISPSVQEHSPPIRRRHSRYLRLEL